MRSSAQRALGQYLLCCFGAAWALGLSGLALGVSMADDAHDSRAPVLAAIVMWVPGLSALLVRFSHRRDATPLPSAGLVRGPLRAYGALWLFAPLVLLACFGASALLGVAQAPAYGSLFAH